jgi:hypothetical protein
VTSDRVHRTLLLVCAISAAACIAELFWLRSAAGLEITRPTVALLFLPWLAAAAANLGVWYSTLARGEPTPLKKMSTVLFRTVTAVFTLAFVALYGWLLFGGS